MREIMTFDRSSQRTWSTNLELDLETRAWERRHPCLPCAPREAPWKQNSRSRKRQAGMPALPGRAPGGLANHRRCWQHAASGL